MPGAEPCMLMLTEASRSIREVKLSPVELTRSCLAMIDRLEPQVKAWVTLDRDGALREAARLEDERRAGRMRGSLHGIPVGVKDIFYTAGMRTTAGHAPMADFVPDYDSAVVERLKAAGAIILGKTTTTEFALLAPTPTRNPWNLDHTPGGVQAAAPARRWQPECAQWLSVRRRAARRFARRRVLRRCRVETNLRTNQRLWDDSTRPQHRSSGNHRARRV